MTAPADLLHGVWSYPLFDALYGRRSRRFAMGFAMTEGPFAYKSRHAPVPLSESWCTWARRVRATTGREQSQRSDFFCGRNASYSRPAYADRADYVIIDDG